MTKTSLCGVEDELGGDGSACFLDLLLGRGTDLQALEGQLPGDVAIPEDLDLVAGLVDQSCIGKGLVSHSGAFFKGGIHLAHVHYFNAVTEQSVVEALLRKTAV